jgi:hypothetical protein
MIQNAEVTLVVEGQLSGQAIERFNGLTVVKSLKILN